MSVRERKKMKQNKVREKVKKARKLAHKRKL